MTRFIQNELRTEEGAEIIASYLKKTDYPKKVDFMD